MSCVWKQENWSHYAIPSFLIIGIQVSYIPQHVSIIMSKSSRGISWISLWLAAISTSCNVVASTISLDVWPKFECCYNEWGFGHCVSSILPEIQLSTGFTNTWVLFLLVILYHETKSDYMVLKPSTDSIDGSQEHVLEKKSGKKKLIMWIVFLLSFLICFVSFFAVGITLNYTLPNKENVIDRYAMAIGILAASAVFVQWTPQIYKTFVNKDPGTLSILFLLLQTPGSFLCVWAFLGIRPWYVWASYAVSGVQQSVTLFLVLLYTPSVRRFFGCASREIDEEARVSLMAQEDRDDYDDPYAENANPSLSRRTPLIS
eukprot:TRINITY_DN4443_c0_g1_i1.p1 TRINITY_DN4443_c0_g1~~TRINITY_DN4443_c0_g1_i1.p1  ORF type:complete len:316 (+),score=50.26 TRINITY_DN4443_c0_g1_i1:128-1075(+)